MMCDLKFIGPPCYTPAELKGQKEQRKEAIEKEIASWFPTFATHLSLNKYSSTTGGLLPIRITLGTDASESEER